MKKVCGEAKKYHFASVCVNPSYIKFVAEELAGSGVTPCCVIGFPFGSHTPEAKAAETAQAVVDGAREVDMVVNLGAVKSGEWDLAERDIAAVVERCADGMAEVTVRNKFCVGDTLEAVQPGEDTFPLTVTALFTMDGAPRDSAPHPMEQLRMPVTRPVKPGSILRIEKRER